MAASSAIQTATVNIQSSNCSVPAYLAHPDEAETLPTVVVIQEIFGVNAHIREVANRIAQEGYIAIAPHIYHRQIEEFEVGYSDVEIKLGRQYKNGTHANELLMDVQGAIRYGRKRFNSPSTGAGCIGFCFGGHVAYLAATLPDIKATASFYGAGITQFTPGGGPPTITRTSEIGGTIYTFFGLQDSLISPLEIDLIEEELKESGVEHRVCRYSDAGHGFFCDHRDSYDSASARDAWQYVKLLFANQLLNA
jgi:carboxymethylenebutenolidase